MSIEYPPFFGEHLELFLNSLRASHGINWELDSCSITEWSPGTYGKVVLNKIGEDLYLTLNGNKRHIATMPRRSSLAWANVFEMLTNTWGPFGTADSIHAAIWGIPKPEFVALLAQIIRDHPVPVSDITVAAKLKAFADKYSPLEV